MTGWLVGRWRSITRRGQFMPFERRVLLNLSVLRDQLTYWGGLVALVVYGAWWVWWLGIPQSHRALGLLAALLASQGAAWATVMALVSADGVENRIRARVLGYAYNPFVSAIGEKEGWMGPVNVIDDQDRQGVADWERMKCGPPPGGNMDPLLKWWGNPGSGSFCS